MERKYILHIEVCDFLELVVVFAKHIMLQNDFSYAIAAYYGRENGRGCVLQSWDQTTIAEIFGHVSHSKYHFFTPLMYV